MVKRVVSIGAHSLDAELLGGPLLLKYSKAGAHCSTWHVTQGRLEDPNANEEEKEAYLKKLLDQNEAAAKVLGADTKWLGYVSSTMPSTEDFAKRLEEDLADVDLVITHWKGSAHPRHVNTHDAVTSAVKNMRLKGSNIKLMYGETFEDLQSFMPQAYFTLTDEEAETWFKALKCYTVFNGGVNDLPYNEYYSSIMKVHEFEANTNKKTVAYMYASLIENELF
ncbi:MAG: PIG-L family deacetylase [Coriobacteriia bacterium]|nr:PIG-L family deacetylase [Coriobacteriia bacterium]